MIVYLAVAVRRDERTHATVVGLHAHSSRGHAEVGELPGCELKVLCERLQSERDHQGEKRTICENLINRLTMTFALCHPPAAILNPLPLLFDEPPSELEGAEPYSFDGPDLFDETGRMPLISS